MTKEELNQWIAKAKLVDYKTQYDENGNCEETRIYGAEGKFFRIEFLNGSPYEAWNGKGFTRGVYPEPREVIRKTEMVEVVVYREKDAVHDDEEYFYSSQSDR